MPNDTVNYPEICEINYYFHEPHSWHISESQFVTINNRITQHLRQQHEIGFHWYISSEETNSVIFCKKKFGGPNGVIISGK